MLSNLVVHGGKIRAKETRKKLGGVGMNCEEGGKRASTSSLTVNSTHQNLCVYTVWFLQGEKNGCLPAPVQNARV